MQDFTRSDYQKAEWAAKVFHESGRAHTTARALHYFALGRTDYPVFNKAGLVAVRKYRDEDANNITSWIALAKRQGLIDWDDLPDETVGEYGELEFFPSVKDFTYGYSLNQPDLVRLSEYLKRENFDFEYEPVERYQPYHIEMWVEKSTMNGILRPLCSKCGAVLVAFKGHCSWGAVWKLCKRVDTDGRPALVFYLSDLDASGFRMAVELCEKVMEINNNFFDGLLNIRVKRFGLSPEHVVEHQIPMVDRKKGEKAHAELYRKYVEAYGLNPAKKAELDALERYYPGGVQAFVENWLHKFFDLDLETKCSEITDRLLDSVPESNCLPDYVIAKRRELLTGLEDLIQIENGLAFPAGGFMDADVDPETDDPYIENWLMDISNRLYPGPDDIDFCREAF
jgi:hypothetical protein